ncbi:MAG: UDP-N-acetylglucosamine 2-epimerase (non-hydrolyzing) [Candidatus Methanoculleus thermohydrogenotrophicum]|mgnify:CR=1 FL=1|jgi:UDP-N-acetylglucosamine 2-epimerase (non-hydrolysing)|nr:UDP-N-acetylglucosamine 2-epimerase (non-hydrolyzing) [Candidatus Methanoculleus thermohydrogenotrophicum]NLM82822.1 UDP-N-acetylglucosamine 2-epimerase (non-hydrolyzing) [Candidatus Methanoculleus thermohydrogenotrophicum]HQC91430.1 UDP-N-acetylglucosamine 2-epimerase (non-hydrolyzing) [Candidatus Methanoculleus thermohydrogenotrophicum]
MKIAVILGTRPEIVKMSPVVRSCLERSVDFSIIHTGQHYSYEMDRIFFCELELPDATYNLEVGSGTHGAQTARMLTGLEQILLEDPHDVVLVQGDTNTVLAGALAAAKLGVPLGHVEAGLRSYDRSMPEEINRVVADHLSDFLFAPTEMAAHNLRKEGRPDSGIFVTGNTVVDAVLQNISLAAEDESIFSRLGIEKGEYILVTAHRQENVDRQENLSDILKGIELVGNEFGVTVLYPIHPRTKKMIERFNLRIPDNLRLLEPLGYFEFLLLEASAQLVLTDSGGIQEECCILKTPCVTMRKNTERPETVVAGGNILAGTDPEAILSAARTMVLRPRTWENPFGDGRSGDRIVRHLKEIIDPTKRRIHYC